MITTSLTFPVTITYESFYHLSEMDKKVLRAEIESSLINTSINGDLDPAGYMLQCVALEVGDSADEASAAPEAPTNKIPATDEDALRHLLTRLSERGWSFLAYDDGGDDIEPFEYVEGLISAVLAVSDKVVVYLRHEEVKGAYIVLLAQDSPEDVLVDHTGMEPLNSDITALWRIFK